FEQGDTEAHRKRDLEGLADMVHLAVNLLDGQGRLAEVLTEIDHAIALTAESPDATSLLLSLKASFLAGTGDRSGARTALLRAQATVTDSPDDFARRKSQMYCAGTTCLLVDSDARESIEA